MLLVGLFLLRGPVVHGCCCCAVVPVFQTHRPCCCLCPDYCCTCRQECTGHMAVVSKPGVFASLYSTHLKASVNECRCWRHKSTAEFHVLSMRYYPTCETSNNVPFVCLLVCFLILRRMGKNKAYACRTKYPNT